MASPRALHALILAAGIGRRLGEAEGRPKCLLEFGGHSLLARHLHLLRDRGVTRISIVAGHRADMVRAASDGAEIIVNPDFHEGSVVSLWVGRAVLESGASVLLMDADVIYDARMLAALIEAPAENCLLLDRELEPGDEPVKVCVAGGRIVDFRKQPEFAHNWHGESVGFFRLAPDAARELAGRAGDYARDGRRHMEYEEPLRDMMLASPGRIGFADITGLPWTEIDFPADVVKADALLPDLMASAWP